MGEWYRTLSRGRQLTADPHHSAIYQALIFNILHTLFSLLEPLLLPLLTSKPFRSKLLYYIFPVFQDRQAFTLPTHTAPCVIAHHIVLVTGLLYDLPVDKELHSRDLAFNPVFPSSVT